MLAIVCFVEQSSFLFCLLGESSGARTFAIVCNLQLRCILVACRRGGYDHAAFEDTAGVCGVMRVKQTAKDKGLPNRHDKP